MARRKEKPSFREGAIIALLVLVLLWLLWILWGIMEKEERARHAAMEAQAELLALTERKEILTENITELNTPRGEEATLREAHGVARPGEEVIIVVVDEQDVGPPLPWWRKVFGWFGL
ncbi:MAG: hypothetical protein AAB440_02350 [Patescibacteria group bacterium]